MSACSCGCESFTLTLTPDGPHHGKLICEVCGRFGGWAPKPRQPLEVGKPALHFGETVTVLWLKNGWAGLERDDGMRFSTKAANVKGLAA